MDGVCAGAVKLQPTPVAVQTAERERERERERETHTHTHTHRHTERAVAGTQRDTGAARDVRLAGLVSQT